MLENIYTTKMSAERKQLQSRFTKIRSRNGKLSKIAASIMAVVIAVTMLCATVVLAAVVNEEENFFVNGKGYAIDIVLIENELATHTDNYFVPLRQTFEALGYEVVYDVDKTNYLNRMEKYHSFPAFDSIINKEFIDENGEKHIITDNSYEWQKQLVTNNINYYIYGATLRMNMQMPIIEMTKDGVTEFCQIGSRAYSNGYAISPVLINGTTYIPLRAVANIIGGQDNVKWDNEKRDTYFEGALTFNEAENTVTINLE